MTSEKFSAMQKTINTDFGRIAYVEQGRGQVALYIHGALLNAYQWRHQLQALSDIRRGIALDTMGMGYTEPKPGQALNIGNQAAMIAAFLDKLGIDQVDLVGSDSGGGIAQVFAAKNPHRVRSLTLTNSEVVGFDENNLTIDQFRASVASGALTKNIQVALIDADQARDSLATAFEYPQRLSPETINHYFHPLVATAEREQMMRDYLLALGSDDLRATEAQLKTLPAPVLLLWGTGDTFFPTTLAYWLRDNLSNVDQLIEIENAKLFFVEEYPDLVNEQLRRFWRQLDQTR